MTITRVLRKMNVRFACLVVCNLSLKRVVHIPARTCTGDVIIVTEGEHPGSKNSRENSKNSRENSHEIIRTVLLSTYLDGSRSSGTIQLIERFFGSDCLVLTVEGWVNLYL